MDGLIITGIIFAIIWYWWGSASAYESAYNTAKQKCKEHDLTLLDDTLEVKKLRLCRHPKGYVQFYREYEFQFSTDGEIRYHGLLVLKGELVTNIKMEAYRDIHSYQEI